MFLRIPHAVIWLSALTLSWAATADAHPFRHLREEIVAEVEEGKVPAFAVAVISDGRIIWEEGFGSLDDAEPIAVSSHTPFSLASVSKPITATAVMVLAGRGEIDLDRPIEDYLGGPRLTGHAGDPSLATVRRVANHTAGLPIHYRFYETGAEQASVEGAIDRYAMLIHPPGTKYHYSNLGYRLLERSLELITGEPLAEVLRREIFTPLGMHGSGLPSAGKIGESSVAPRCGKDGRPLPFYHSDHPGGSDIYASSHDLVRFAALHLGTLMSDQEEILDPRSRREMRRRGLPRLRERDHYGLGWVIEGNGTQGGIVRFTGGMPGTRTALYLLPQRRVAVAALESGEGDLSQRVARQVMAYYQRRLPAEWRHDSPPRRESATWRRASRRLRGTWSGQIVVDGQAVPLSLTIEKGGESRVRFGSASETSVIGPRYGRRDLTGWVAQVDLPSSDLSRGRYRLQLNLRLDEDRLRGTAIAHGRNEADLPFALAHWIDLER